MGLLGTLVGWDQQKDAHNAVLASHLAENASPELKRDIANRLVIIQQQVRGEHDPYSILTELSCQPRIVQTNFVALACNSLGIPPGLKNLSFMDVDNPYKSQNNRSLNRIGVSLDDLSRRSGRQLNWPGNDILIDFVAWTNLPLPNELSQKGRFAAHSAINVKDAADLATSTLLLNEVEHDLVLLIAEQLQDVLLTRSNHELALATALFFFEQEELKPRLRTAQLVARLTVVSWLEDGYISLGSNKHFENVLYQHYS